MRGAERLYHNTKEGLDSWKNRTANWGGANHFISTDSEMQPRSMRYKFFKALRVWFEKKETEQASRERHRKIGEHLQKFKTKREKNLTLERARAATK